MVRWTRCAFWTRRRRDEAMREHGDPSSNLRVACSAQTGARSPGTPRRRCLRASTKSLGVCNWVFRAQAPTARPSAGGDSTHGPARVMRSRSEPRTHSGARRECDAQTDGRTHTERRRPRGVCLCTGLVCGCFCRVLPSRPCTQSRSSKTLENDQSCWLARTVAPTRPAHHRSASVYTGGGVAYRIG